MYPGTFIEASIKHLPDIPLNCNRKEAARRGFLYVRLTGGDCDDKMLKM